MYTRWIAFYSIRIEIATSTAINETIGANDRNENREKGET